MADPDYHPTDEAGGPTTEDDFHSQIEGGIDAEELDALESSEDESNNNHQDGTSEEEGSNDDAHLETIQEGSNNHDNDGDDADDEQGDSDGTDEDSFGHEEDPPINHDEEDEPQVADDPQNTDDEEDSVTESTQHRTRRSAQITGVQPEQMDATYGSRTRAGLRERKQRKYDKHLHLQQPSDHTMAQYMADPGTPSEVVMTQFLLEHVALTQYSINKGLKVFGNAGAEAVISEMKQLHDRKVGEPDHWRSYWPRSTTKPMTNTSCTRKESPSST
ncbi:hypothetical protein SEMRO_603_G174000.1 [Seminavis robusta]|uniref:Uncharacterized protein n=1 Tax=Seminavis robusta TaxID=568900 RepID=A0A9N8HG02_9STRA|nr:hypothetical protein SEMRO_603_G174000.1 [Seminavis robusta]|eukprot:Sro603_g174000.1 n/a (274) ;mRNA; f:40251-41362